jgi:hypothetical protein
MCSAVLSVCAQAGYDFAVGDTDSGRRRCIEGDIGLWLTFGHPRQSVAATVAVAAARSYLVCFDWDKATLTDRARQIIRQPADNWTHV